MLFCYWIVAANRRCISEEEVEWHFAVSVRVFTKILFQMVAYKIIALLSVKISPFLFKNNFLKTGKTVWKLPVYLHFYLFYFLSSFMALQNLESNVHTWCFKVLSTITKLLSAQPQTAVSLAAVERDSATLSRYLSSFPCASREDCATMQWASIQNWSSFPRNVPTT